jgi:hypothetical protein
MATKQDLMGLGVPYPIANLQGVGPDTLVAVGTAVGSAAQIGGQAFVTKVLTGTSAVKVPLIGGDTGCLIGDIFALVNLSAASLSLFAANNALGSVVTFLPAATGTSAAGSTGLSVGTGRTAVMQAITVSCWAVFCGASAA